MMAEGTPYELGMYQPNFIYDQNGQAKIVEINCQYPINYWMLSHYLNEVAYSITNNEKWDSIPNQNNFLGEFGNLFDLEEPIFLIRTKGKKPEINFLQNELPEKKIHFIEVAPEDFKIEDGQLKAMGKIARQFYLEVNREELKSFDKKVLKKIIQSGRCINDVRSIILIHDRRLLTILHNQNIMGTYINSTDYMFLSSFLTPSFTINQQQDRDYLLNASENWVLKRNSGNGEVNTYVKKEIPKDVWENVVKNDWENYMVQTYIDQKEFILKDESARKLIKLTNSDLYFNGKSFGPGMFKGKMVVEKSEEKLLLASFLEKNTQ